MRVRPIFLAACLLTSALAQVTVASSLETKDADASVQMSAEGAESKITDQDGSEEAIDEKDVAVLTKMNFDEAIKSHNFSLVEFYAPWCGHCKTLAPHYAKAATALKAYDPSILIAKVDSTEHPDLTQRYGVEGFPTMKWFVGGEVLEYNGGRVEKDIIQWVKKKTGPPAKTVNTIEELKAAANIPGPVVVAYFASFEGAAHADFLTVARSADKLEFLQTNNTVVAKEAGAEKGIVMHREFEGKKEAAHFSGDGKDALKAWVKAEQIPPYMEFKEENQDAIFDSGVPLSALVVMKREDMAKGSAVTTAVKVAAAVTKGKVVWVLVDVAGDAFQQIAEFFGIKSDGTLPKVVAFNMETTRQYAMENGPLTDATLKAFGMGIADGSIKPQLKSDEIPSAGEEKDEGVTVVVGKNFEQVVKDSDHDVLLEAYAPWCGHCQKLAPTYAKLAKRFENSSSIVIAKIDGTTNEHEDFKAEGYPTIWLWPAGAGSKAILYEGERSLKGLTAFVRKNAKLPVKLKQTDTEMDAEDLKDQEEAATRGEEGDEGGDDASDEEDEEEAGATKEGAAGEATAAEGAKDKKDAEPEKGKAREHDEL